MEFLRRHTTATLLVSATLIAFGSWAVFFQDPEDLSDSRMLVTLAGFIAWCAGLAAISILIFRPIEFTKDDAATWEVTRLEGKRRFVTRFLLMASPFLIGVFGGIWETSDLTTLLLVLGLFFGLSFIGADALWKYFQQEHSIVATSVTIREKETGAKAPAELREGQPISEDISGSDMKQSKRSPLIRGDR